MTVQSHSLSTDAENFGWLLNRFAEQTQGVHEAIAVSEDEIAAAVRFLHHEAGLSTEPSGAVGVAALLAGRVAPGAGPIAVVVSGGNVDPDLYADLVR